MRETIREVGYTRAKYGFDYETCARAHRHQAAVARHRDGRRHRRGGRPGADVRLRLRRDPRADAAADHAGAQARRSGSPRRAAEEILPFLRPDGKSQVTVEYEDGKPVRVDTVVVSTQHGDEGDHRRDLRRGVEKEIIRPVIPAELLDAKTKFHINPTGRFVDRRAARRHGPDRPQDHRGHLRRHGQPRRRRLLRQGPDEGRSLGLLHGPLHRQEHRGGRTRGPRARCSSPTPSASPSRSRSWWTRFEHRQDRPRTRSTRSCASTSR